MSYLRSVGSGALAWSSPDMHRGNTCVQHAQMSRGAVRLGVAVQVVVHVNLVRRVIVPKELDLLLTLPV